MDHVDSCDSVTAATRHIVERLAAQAERTSDRQLKSQLWEAACEVLDHAIVTHRPPRIPDDDDVLD